MKILSFNKFYAGPQPEPMEAMAILEALTDDEIKWNFLSNLALTGHPVTQADVDIFRKEMRSELIPKIRTILLDRKIFVEDNV